MHFIHLKVSFFAFFVFVFSSAFANKEYQVDEAISKVEDLILEAIDVNTEQAYSLIDSLDSFSEVRPDLIRALKSFYSGELCYSMGEWNNARHYYTSSIESFTAIHDTVKLTIAYNNLGLVDYIQGEYDKALNAYLKSLELEKALDNAVGIAQCYHNIGIVYFEGGKKNKALDFYKKALDVYLQEEVLEDAAAIYNNLAKVYAEDGMYDKAEEYYYEAIGVYRRLRNGKSEARVLCNLGNLKVRNAEYDQASHLIERALFLLKSEGDKLGEVNAYSMLGDLYSEKKEYRQAVFLYKEAEKLASNQDRKDILIKNTLSLYLAYKSLGLWKDALKTYERYVSLLDQMKDDNPVFNESALSLELEHKMAEMDDFIRSSQKNERICRMLLILVSLMAFVGFLLINNQRKRLISQREVGVLKKRSMYYKGNPDFIYNLLTILKLGDLKDAGDTALIHFSKVSDFIKQMLEFSSQELISLSKEIEYCKLFVAVQEQQLKRPIHFNVVCNMSNDSDEVMVPSMMTQAFLEQSLIHCRQEKADKDIFINLAFVRRGNILEVILEDNNLGLCVYADEKLVEIHSVMAKIIFMDQLKGRRSKRNRLNCFGQYTVEERFNGDQKLGYRVRFSIPLMVK